MVRQPTGSSRPKESSMRCSDDGVVSEDLLDLIRVFWISSYPDTGLGIGREFGAAKEKGVDLIETDAVEVDFSDNEIEAMGFEFFFDSEDFIKGAGLFGVSDLKGEGQEFDFGFLDSFRETGGRAIDSDLDLSADMTVGGPSAYRGFFFGRFR